MAGETPIELETALPLYIQIANYLRELVGGGALHPGDEVPAERVLAEQFRVSRPTVTRALDALKREGVLESRQGAGTYVRDEPVLFRRSRDRYVRARKTGAARPPHERSAMLAVERIPAPEYVASELHLRDGEPVVHRRRVVRDGRGPIELSSSWLPGAVGDVVPRLLEPTSIPEGTVVHLEGVLGRIATTAQNRVFARLATDQERQELELGPEPAAVLSVHHVVYDQDGEVIEFTEEVHPPGHGRFRDAYRI